MPLLVGKGGVVKELVILLLLTLAGLGYPPNVDEALNCVTCSGTSSNQLTEKMSTIYSAGQYDDAFSPKRLGNWESTAKESYPFGKSFSKSHSLPKIISNSRGHLLPWVPRSSKTSPWGLLNFHLRNKFHHHHRTVLMSGPGKQPNSSTSNIQKRLKKLPKFCPRKSEPGPPPDLLLEYLQHLRLPIIWIIGPATRNTVKKRQAFAKQLATNLNFGYVSLEEKIQEWKDRQQICTCSVTPPQLTPGPPPSPPPGPLHNLASTSIAPCKLPTSVPPCISANIPSPPQTPHASSANAYLLSILESQRITFDTALPLERQKILELYKFAMAECLPCSGFVLDSTPFDLVEGLQFEKIFYPAALAIYFTEGVPSKNKKVKPKDRRVTASTATSTYSHAGHTPKGILMSPLEYLEHRHAKRAAENVYLKPKSHKRLGVFNLAEGDKICKQFGGKTIRIINAEDVERDTMDFLNELVQRNLARYQDIAEGKCKLDYGMDGQLLPAVVSQEYVISPKTNYSRQSFILEEEEKQMELREEGEDDGVEEKVDRPPALITAHQSDTSLFTLPNIFKTGSESENSLASSARGSRKEDEVEVDHQFRGQEDGSGDHLQVNAREDSAKKPEVVKKEKHKGAELWERIVKLESKVAELQPQEVEVDKRYLSKNRFPRKAEDYQVPEDNEEIYYAAPEIEVLPPPTAFQEEENEQPEVALKVENRDQEDTELYTQAIRNAIRSVSPPEYQFVPYPPQEEYGYRGKYQQTEYDYGASGDHFQTTSDTQTTYSQAQDKYGTRKPVQSINRKYPPHNSSGSNTTNHYPEEDPFYDDI